MTINTILGRAVLTNPSLHTNADMRFLSQLFRIKKIYKFTLQWVAWRTILTRDQREWPPWETPRRTWSRRRSVSDSARRTTTWRRCSSLTIREKENCLVPYLFLFSVSESWALPIVIKIIHIFLTPTLSSVWCLNFNPSYLAVDKKVWWYSNASFTNLVFSIQELTRSLGENWV